MANRRKPARPEHNAREPAPPRGARSKRIADELAGLLEAGDHRAAAATARQALASPEGNAQDRPAALAALERVGPDRAVALAAAAGLGLLFAVAILGLLRS